MTKPTKHAPWATLTAQREAQGLTKAALAARAGIHPTHISSLENGKIRPRIESVRKIAGALGVPIGAIPVPGKTEGTVLTEDRVRAIISEMIEAHRGEAEDGTLSEDTLDVEGSDPELIRVSRNMSSRPFTRAVRALRGDEHDYAEMASLADMLDDAARVLRKAAAEAATYEKVEAL